MPRGATTVSHDAPRHDVGRHVTPCGRRLFLSSSFSVLPFTQIRPPPPTPSNHKQAGSAPGQTFNIEHEGRYFEVVVPAGSNAGETITIVGVGANEQQFESIQSIQEAALIKAKALNEYFKIQERATVATQTVFSKAQELDAKYSISQMPIVISSTAIASNYLKVPPPLP